MISELWSILEFCLEIEKIRVSRSASAACGIRSCNDRIFKTPRPFVSRRVHRIRLIEVREEVILVRETAADKKQV